MAKQKVHVGDRFGDLVVEKTYMTNAMRCVCRCKCGNTIDCYTSALLVRKNPTCGCEKRERPSKEIPDRLLAMKGKVFGSLEVLDVFRPTPPGNQGVYVTKLRCRCLNCGTVTEPSASAVLRGAIKSCRTCNRKIREMAKDAIDASFVGGTNVTQIDGRRRINKNNTTGYNGVSRIGDRYRAYITFRRKQYNLGIYKTPEDAAAARKEAEERIYGNFLQWYAETYPEQWDKIKREKEEGGK